MSEKRLLTWPDGIFRKNLFHLYYQTTFQAGKCISLGQLVLMGSENDTVFGLLQAKRFEGGKKCFIRLTSDSFDKISLHHTVNTIFLFTTQCCFWKTNLKMTVERGQNHLRQSQVVSQKTFWPFMGKLRNFQIKKLLFLFVDWEL